jgi:enediyne biosynthesis protein E5
MIALWYFGTLITVWTLAGHTVLGFEQSYAQPIAGVSSAVGTTFFLEWLRAWSMDERPRFFGSFANLASLILPAWIAGLAVSFLLYPNERIAPCLCGGRVDLLKSTDTRAF